LPHGVAVVARPETQPNVERMRLLELLLVEIDAQTGPFRHPELARLTVSSVIA
jgi:hypothetical protein